MNEPMRRILVSFDERTLTYKVNYELWEETGFGTAWQEGGALLTVAHVGDRLVAQHIKTKKPMYAWKDKFEMIEELTMQYECAVKLL